MPTLQELSVEYAHRQPHQVDHILSRAPILAAVPWEESSHDLWNVYSEVTHADSAEFVDLDSPLPELDAGTALKKQDLSIMGGTMYVGEDKARLLGSAARAFSQKLPAILQKTGMTTEKAILYRNLLTYAIAQRRAGDTERVIDAGGTDNLFVLIAVRWIPGETTGLYSPKGFNQGALLNAKRINGGNLHKINDEGVLGYGMRLKNYFGFQIATPESVAAIVNISASKVPTAMQVDDLLDAVDADNGNTFLYCHSKVKTFLRKHKNEIVTMDVKNRHIDRRLETWNDVPFIPSRNFNKGTEQKVTFS